MSEIRIQSIKVKNYRSFGEEQQFLFPSRGYSKPVAIVGYNNSGKTNLINAIKYGLYESVREDTFELKDFHNCQISNSPHIQLGFTSVGLGDDKILDNQSYRNTINVICDSQSIQSVVDGCNASSFNGREFSKKWVIKQNAPIFYINFHKIKEEISTKKTSWGNLTSFLAKHIKKIVDNDSGMASKRATYEQNVKDATDIVLEGSMLSVFISKIKENYSTNLRDNNCEIAFGLPDYEDIFLQMIFKIGLNGDNTNLIPIDHFGDGYISMFVMAVIQAIAESNTDDKCLFLFEEPESFLHENHQEYFYKMVLCNLSERGHQVIYTTHSDKMVDIFDTKSIIRLEFDENLKQTIKKYNNVGEFNPIDSSAVSSNNIISLENYNNFIKFVEPNLNKILFSRKVVLVEGANDILVYRYFIEKEVERLKGNKKYAQTYLNFLNIAIIVHQGKATAWLLIELCKHFKLDYFVINDLDFNDTTLISKLADFSTEEVLKADIFYTSLQDDSDSTAATKKGKLTTNWKLINHATRDKIHFNVPKLETVLGYTSNDKNSLKIWNQISSMNILDTFFPQKLKDFLEFDGITVLSSQIIPEIQNEEDEEDNDLPF